MPDEASKPDTRNVTRPQLLNRDERFRQKSPAQKVIELQKRFAECQAPWYRINHSVASVLIIPAAVLSAGCLDAFYLSSRKGEMAQSMRLLAMVLAALATALVGAFVVPSAGRYRLFAKLFVRSFVDVPDTELRALRKLLESNLQFRHYTCHVDLRFVLNAASSADRARLLRKIERAAHSYEPHHDGMPLAADRPFIVMSDVDDTVTPGHDALGVSGMDKSTAAGSMYPCCVEMHKALRGAGQHTVMLTARPPFMVSSLARKLEALSAMADGDLRLGILPGVGPTKVVQGLVSILRGNRRGKGSSISALYSDQVFF